MTMKDLYKIFVEVFVIIISTKCRINSGVNYPFRTSLATANYVNI